MDKKKKKEIGIVLLLLVAVVAMTIGFAAYTQDLNITGNVTVKASKWDVHYNPNDYHETTGSVAATAHTLGDTDFSFTVTLTKPGDFYETTINAKNFGTIDAVLKSVTMSSLTAQQAKYLKYSVKVNGTEYLTTTSGLSVDLNAGQTNNTHPVIVRVEYLTPENSSDLPAIDQTVTVTGTLHYESK